MTQKLYFIIAILCAIAGMTNTAMAETKTYIFEGQQEGLAQRLAHDGNYYLRSPLCRAFRLLLPPPCLVNISLCSSVLS